MKNREPRRCPREGFDGANGATRRCDGENFVGIA